MCGAAYERAVNFLKLTHLSFGESLCSQTTKKEELNVCCQSRGGPPRLFRCSPLPCNPRPAPFGIFVVVWHRIRRCLGSLRPRVGVKSRRGGGLMGGLGQFGQLKDKHVSQPVGLGDADQAAGCPFDEAKARRLGQLGHQRTKRVRCARLEPVAWLTGEHQPRRRIARPRVGRGAPRQWQKGHAPSTLWRCRGRGGCPRPAVASR